MRFQFFFSKRGRYIASDRLSLIIFPPSFSVSFCPSSRYAVYQACIWWRYDARTLRLNQAVTHFREVNQVSLVILPLFCNNNIARAPYLPDYNVIRAGTGELRWIQICILSIRRLPGVRYASDINHPNARDECRRHMESARSLTLKMLERKWLFRGDDNFTSR